MVTRMLQHTSPHIQTGLAFALVHTGSRLDARFPQHNLFRQRHRVVKLLHLWVDGYVAAIQRSEEAHQLDVFCA